MIGPGRETVQGITVTQVRTPKGTYDKVEGTPFPIHGCSMQPLSTTEQVSQTDITISTWKLLLPAATPLTATSKVLAYGLKFQVAGDPQTVPDINGRPHHMIALLRRSNG